MRSSDTLPIILIVTADNYKSAFFKRTLKGLFNVIEISDSSAAVERLKNMQPSLIILDEKTLSTTWSIVASYVRIQSGYNHIPLLLITNNLKKSFMVGALNIGITDFLNEPFEQDEIFQRILAATQSKPGEKKVAMMTKKIKKTISPSLGKLSSPHRFVITEEAMKEVATAQKKYPSLSLLLLEIDDFQNIAHEMREDDVQKLLSHIRNLCRAHERHLELILPQGSGRFLLLLPNTTHQEAMELAETLRKEAQAKPFHAQTHLFSLSLSIGVVALDKDSSQGAYDQVGSLLEKVDKALNKAKRKGNRTISE